MAAQGEGTEGAWLLLCSVATDTGSQAPTIVALTEQFNFNAQWLMEELATASEDTVRTEVLEKAIKIAAVCPI